MITNFIIYYFNNIVIITPILLNINYKKHTLRKFVENNNIFITKQKKSFTYILLLQN